LLYDILKNIVHVHTHIHTNTYILYYI